MPSTSKAQLRFMEAVKHSPKFAKKVGVPQSVGREFTGNEKDYSSLPEKKKRISKSLKRMK